MGFAGKLIAGSIAALLLATGGATACPLGNTAEELRNGKLSLFWMPVGEIRVSEPFDLEICASANGSAPEPALVDVDAVMPAHGHGMNYRAEVRQVEAGYFVAEGLLFHMPGHWEIRFELDWNGSRAGFVSSVDLQ
jgi:hypothetical protein